MKKLLLIGAGGVGSRIVPLIHTMYEITVMDGDTFEKKNLIRQVLTRKHIGMNKADAMADMYGVQSIPEFLIDPEQLDRGFDIVVCVPDNHMCRMMAILAADRYEFDLVLAGNEEYTANAMYYNQKYQGTSVDPRIRYPEMLRKAEKEAGQTCVEVLDTKPQTALANNMAASLALALVTYWMGNPPSPALIATHAPFEHIWDLSSVHTVKGYTS